MYAFLCDLVTIIAFFKELVISTKISKNGNCWIENISFNSALKNYAKHENDTEKNGT